MVSRKPARAALPHTVTIWNKYGERVVNGSKQSQYQRTILRYVRADFQKRTNVRASGGAENADDLFLMVFAGVSQAFSEDGVPRRFVPSPVFLRAGEEERAGLWTLNPGDDFVGLGIQLGEPSGGGERAAKSYKINIVDPKYGAGAEVHHWEVSGR